MSSGDVSIAGRSIGPGHPPYLVAELSGNHNGELNRALALMDAAKEAGASAIKLQSYTADTLTIDHDGPGFKVDGGAWDGYTLYDLYTEAGTPWEWHPTLFSKGRELGVTVFSTPFDETAVDMLEELDAPAYKIASFEIVDLPLIAKAAATNKPLVISTGMANLEEIQEAVATARQHGDGGLVILHCVSSYPAPPEQINLCTLGDLAKSLDAVVGLSDHTLGTAVSVAAVALGASMIEKHFTLRRSEGGVDSHFSLEPEEFAELVSASNTAWAALGSATYDRQPSEVETSMYRRSLYAVANIEAGDTFTRENIRSIRPGLGLSPKYLPKVLGKKARENIVRGTPLSWDAVD